MNKISVHKLVKTFQGKKILNKVSFEIESNQVVTLLGGSGAGKSTLLRCLSALESADEGEIHLHGKKVGIVLQQLHLWKHMSVLNNLITAPIHVLKKSKKIAIDEAKDLLAQLKILDKSDCYPSQLSGGEEQRVAIARALMMKPDVMLFDEPTSALDPERTQSVSEIIQSLAKNGMTILAATHDLAFAKSVGHLAMFLENGHILEVADVKNKEIKTKTKRFTQFLHHESANDS